MALSWNDIFDFSSLDEPSTPPPAFDPTQRDICSDFSCCGLSLPDLHALVDHFEEHHVVTNGRPTCSPLVLSYPQPDPPAEPSSLFGASSPFASATHPHLYPHPDGFEHDFSDGTSDSASYSSGSTLPLAQPQRTHVSPALPPHRPPATPTRRPPTASTGDRTPQRSAPRASQARTGAHKAESVQGEGSVAGRGPPPAHPATRATRGDAQETARARAREGVQVSRESLRVLLALPDH
ncbi:hypothetical protein EVJ58_g3634 [Rhodofomes roseus]|uniref:Uncharacterized protein n=1 Tax=Rhodofomes roseus TaxID=34475 RepID=A0A4Y9YP42_9APHY|nr:hypothetical protein EVJ58_g3634 [Rhodofomes roseus]